MWRTTLWAMLWNISWRRQGLVMAKDPCKATITKRLAWLVEQLVVSNHEFSKSFIIFSIVVFTILLVHFCFHFLYHKFHLFSIFQITSSRFHLHFPLILFCVLLRFYFLVFPSPIPFLSLCLFYHFFSSSSLFSFLFLKQWRTC